ncbi:hypothetical protein ABBQ38_002149 [Trebouxia sp. C0009 RCD-2024]
MASTYEPEFTSEAVPPSSDHPSYHPVAIQLYGHASKFSGTTTNHDDYRAWELPHRDAPPPVAPRVSVPFDAETSYHDTYHAHPLEAPTRHHAEPWKDNGVKFEGQSAYDSDFHAHPLERRAPMLPAPPPRNSAKFDGTSTYHDQYPAHQIQAHVPQHGPRYEHKNVPFEGTTTNQDAYKAYAIEPHRAMHAPVVARPYTKFEGTTTNQDAYKPYDVHPREQHHVDYTYNPTPFEGSTESHDAYKQWQLEKRAAPPSPPMRISLPFEGTTTNKDMFKGWELPKKRPTIGIAMVGDQQHVLIPSTLTVPCHGKQIFTTVHDNQPHMSFVIYAGESRVASSNRQLGQFQLKGVPPAAFGVPQIEVTAHLDSNNILTIDAQDLDSGRHHLWKHGGGSVVADGIQADQLNTNGHYVVDYTQSLQPVRA